LLCFIVPIQPFTQAKILEISARNAVACTSCEDILLFGEQQVRNEIMQKEGRRWKVMRRRSSGNSERDGKT
jgi:hypothetical protein